MYTYMSTCMYTYMYVDVHVHVYSSGVRTNEDIIVRTGPTVTSIIITHEYSLENAVI